MVSTSAERGALHLSEGPNNLIIPGPTPDFRFNYQGFRGRFAIEAVVEGFKGDSLKNKRNLEVLKGLAVQVDQAVFGIGYDQARSEVDHNTKPASRSGSIFVVRLVDARLVEEHGMEKILAMSGKFFTSIAEMLNLEQAKPVERHSIDGYIGYATAESFMVPGERGLVKTVYISTEAILEQYRQLGLGAKIIQIADLLYKPQVITFRARSGRMVRSLIRSGLVSEKRIYPRYRPFNEDRDKSKILTSLEKRTINPNGVNPWTGVAKRIYEEVIDMAYTSDEGHKESYEWDMWMKNAGMDAADGDGMFFAADVIGRSQNADTN